jgi:hypothetical protein
MQSSFFTAKYIGFFSKSVFQCELHLILNSFLTRIIALYQNLKEYFLSCWYTLEHKLNFSVVLFFVQQSGLPSLDRCEIVLRSVEFLFL